jgi:hypothetical protein
LFPFSKGGKNLWQLLAPRSRTSTPQAVPEGKAMNRIYQGKVTAVEIPDGKDEQGKPLDRSIIGNRLFRIGHTAKPLDAVNF